MINLFYNDYLKKPILNSFIVNITPSMTKLIVKPIKLTHFKEKTVIQEKSKLIKKLKSDINKFYLGF